MKKTSMFLVCVVVLLFADCRKNKHEFTIKGQISDSTFGGTLNNCQISLYEIEAGAADSSLIGTINSANGSYSFTFERRKAESYTLSVTKNNYFEISKKIPFGDLTTKEDNVYNYVTNAKAWAWIHLVNLNPQPGDQLNFIKQAGKTNCLECCSMEQQFIYGPVADTSIYCINDGNSTYSLIWSDPVNGTNGVASVTTIAFDTTELLVEY